MIETKPLPLNPDGRLGHLTVDATDEPSRGVRHPGQRIGAQELLDNPPPPLRFVVDDLIPVGLTALSGRPKSGKSLLSLDLAVSVALGQDFLDLRTTAGGVLHFALEDGERRQSTRMQARAGTDPIVNLEIVFDGVHNLADLLTIAQEWVDECTNPRLIIIDLYQYIAPKGRDAKDYSPVYDTLKELRSFALKHNLAIVIIHHTKKGNNQETDVFDTPHGTTAITGACDTSLVLTRIKDSENRLLSIRGRDIVNIVCYLLSGW